MAQEGGHAEEDGGGVEFAVARGQFGFDVLEVFGEAGELGLVGGEEFFLEGLELEGSGKGDVLVELAVPIDEGTSADVEVVGSAGEAPAFGPQLDELMFHFYIVHGGRMTRKGTGAAAPGTVK